MKLSELKEFLDEKSDKYNHPDFILNDPIRLPHRYGKKQDIEIAGFLAATIAWGNRKSIINDGEKILSWLDDDPHHFVLNFTDGDIQFLKNRSVHRTFNGDDLICFLTNLQKIYRDYDSLEPLFLLHDGEPNFYHAIERFRNQFFGEDSLPRSFKHVSSTYKNSAAKRLMMFLRWMVRKDSRGVDFGIWENIDAKYLSVPLDVHTGNVSRRLKLVKRKQNDWKTVEELDIKLRKMDVADPAKYDFALFGLGIDGEI